ncbi:MAG: hypothetical protein ACOX4O_04745 [Eubacteriales bacterium]
MSIGGEETLRGWGKVNKDLALELNDALSASFMGEGSDLIQLPHHA